jgi:hypothetical protein
MGLGHIHPNRIILVTYLSWGCYAFVYLVPTHPAIPRPHASMDHRHNSLPFLIYNSNYYSLMSQTFMLQGSHTGPPPMMSWGGSPADGEPLTWPPPPPPGGYWPPPLLCGYCLPPPLVGYPGQSSSTPPPPSSQGYWPPPPWAPLAAGQAPLWGMPPWMTPTPHRPFSPSTVSHLCIYFQLFHL